MARVLVDVMLKPEILDPQGQAVADALPRLGVSEVRSVRIGRRIELEFDGTPTVEVVNELADRLLANPVIEDYHVTIVSERSSEASDAADIAVSERSSEASDAAGVADERAGVADERADVAEEPAVAGESR